MAAGKNLCGRTGTENNTKTRIMIWFVEETLKENHRIIGRLITLHTFMEPNS